MKTLLCKIGFHKKVYCSAPFVLEGIIGRIETWVCGRCGYKNKNGIFIKEANK